MGTYYKVTFSKGEEELKKEEIEALLLDLNSALSTYQENSIISQFNLNQLTSLDLNVPTHKYFYEVLERSKYFYNISENYFDPTVMPLVNFYGFGYMGREEDNELDMTKIQNILDYVSLDKLNWQKQESQIVLEKDNPKLELDFSAIAKGYGVDIISTMLEKKKIKNFLVDIGGEINVKGKNPKGKNWNLGISRPLDHADYNDAQIIVTLSDKALATSGNYRNFYELNGVKYGHTINPITGRSQRSNLLGTSIIASNCMDADALATVCMVIGLEKSKALLDQLDDFEGCLIYNESDSLQLHYSKGFEAYVKNQ